MKIPLMHRSLKHFIVSLFLFSHFIFAADNNQPSKTPIKPLDVVNRACFDFLRELGSHSFDDFRRPSFTERKQQTASYPDAPARNFNEVLNAFKPISGSPDAKYSDLTLMNHEAQKEWNRIPQRKAESDMMAASLVENQIQEYKNLGALVIVDSGAAHSIAIATTLAEGGYQPIIKMGNISERKDRELQLQPVAAMRFYAPRMEAAKANLKPESPAAIVMDTHRDALDLSDIHKPWAEYPPDSFPSVEEVKMKYHGRIIWVTEGDERGIVKRDDYTPPFLQHYRDAGIEIYQHFANPYHQGT
ncbi:MAG: hypothetical protein JWQ35_222, partial [Bacteriovoracaceae bacterium]|nr:hypothetical protein [Bacteriovoracaceae bacterium]